MIARKPAFAMTKLLLRYPCIVLKPVELIEVDRLDGLIVFRQVFIRDSQASKKGQNDETRHPHG
jgi:hypothetical protein